MAIEFQGPTEFESGTADSEIGTADKAKSVVSITVNADTGAAATLTVYDNNAASGTVLVILDALAGTANHLFFGDQGVYCANSVYADIGGSSANFTVTYREDK